MGGYNTDLLLEEDEVSEVEWISSHKLKKLLIEDPNWVHAPYEQQMLDLIKRVAKESNLM